MHYAWVEGHAVKAPVGVWGEGGVSFYPEEWADFHADGSQAETESAGKPWAEWVEMRSEFGSTYGAHWRAVESDRSMEDVLTDLQKKFFAEPHPMLTFAQTAVDAEAAGPTEQQPEGERPAAVAPLEPAQRFVLAQAWWIASELCRRRSSLRVLETWPMGGFYHGLEVGEHEVKRWVFMNFVGSIHLHVGKSEVEPVTWAHVMAAQSPHEVVRMIEAQMSWRSPSADRTTPRSLTYRVLAACLTYCLNDRNPWMVADGRTEAGVSEWTDGDPTFLDEFDGAQRWYRVAGGDTAALARFGCYAAARGA